MFQIRSAHLIQYPTGRFGFVGAVPADLAYIGTDGQPLTAELYAKVRDFGPGMFRDAVKTRTWPTREAALADAAQLGYTVKG